MATSPAACVLRGLSMAFSEPDHYRPLRFLAVKYGRRTKLRPRRCAAYDLIFGPLWQMQGHHSRASEDQGDIVATVQTTKIWVNNSLKNTIIII